MLDQVLDVFDLKPGCNFGLMTSNQTLSDLTTAILKTMSPLLMREKPDWVIVQGDTTTAFATALAAFYQHIPVAHVEAGLRTGNRLSPFPEEVNRKLISQIATLHFTPTQWAADNLRNEGVADAEIIITGNTVIDALHIVSTRINADTALHGKLADEFNFLDPTKKLILVTGHRRENLDGGLGNMCEALLSLAKRGDVEIVYPVHLNPAVQNTVMQRLADQPAIHLIKPLAYVPFLYLMQKCSFIITDSGGIQEEAPAFGKPTLVTRDTTERPEAIDAGTAILVGRSSLALTHAATQLLDDEAVYTRMAVAKNPFGDGNAAERIVAALLGWQNEVRR